MSRLTIYQDNYADTTIVSNLLIDEYNLNNFYIDFNLKNIDK